MTMTVRLYDGGSEQGPLGQVILGNALMVLLLGIGTTACWLVSPAFGIAYLIISTGSVYGLLRRLVCTRCYYYGKRCGAGWGLLASWFFSRRPLDEFSDNPGVRLAPLVYGGITLVPLVVSVGLLIRGATTALVILPALLLALGFYSSGPGRRRACSACKMRLVCKGSMVK